MQAESSIASIISAEETKEAKVRKFKIDTLRAKAVTKANVGIISYFNNGLKETDRLAFEESLSELTQLGLGGDEKAGKLVKVITEFYQSEQQRYEEDVDELKEFDPAELASAYELMASARTESEVFKILTVLTDSDGQKLNKSEVKQLLTYGLTNAGAGQEKFDLTDSTSSARMFLGQLEDLYPRPKPEEWDSQEAYYKVTQANAWTRSILSRDFQNRYLRMYKEKKDSLGGAEPTDEDKFQISKTIYTQMSQIYISNATRAEALKRLQEVVPE
jgi:hypothetical protein